MEEKTKKILEYLEPFGIGHYTDISSMLNEFYPIIDKHDTSEVHSKARPAQDFFMGLLGAKYIKARDTEIRGLGTGNSSGGYTWFSNLRVEVSIASEGLEALALERAKATDNKMEKSVLTTNASIERLNGISETFIKFQRKWIVITAIAAGLAAILSLVSLFQTPTSYVKEMPKTDSILQKTSKEIELINKTVNDIQDSLKTLKNVSTYNPQQKSPR